MADLSKAAPQMDLHTLYDTVKLAEMDMGKVIRTPSASRTPIERARAADKAR
jgi:hypothetical protein